MPGSELDILWVEKYRPRSLDEIVNQKEIVDRLKKFVREKNMPHLLFAGPPGTGKTTAAHALAHDLYGENYKQYMLELNASIHGDTPILVRIGGKVKLVRIGDLIDDAMDRYGGVEAGESHYVKVGGIEVLAYSPRGGVGWYRVAHMVKHRVRAYLQVRLRGGGTLKLTGNHSVFVAEDGEVKLTSASQLDAGSKLLTFAQPVASYTASYTSVSLAMLSVARRREASIFELSLREREAIVRTIAAGASELPREDPVAVAWLARMSGFKSFISREKQGTVIDEDSAWEILEPVQVSEVELVEEPAYVYDISVPETGNFFAGEIPILLHNSDERGINVIREKVKEFARSRTPPGIPFKIVLLDEADNMTADAQQALRRLMELYTASTRFILIANYPSKIIDPIQSRCAFFRFTPLKKEDVIARLRFIAESEGVEYEEEALDAIYEISEGDMRKAINILQSTAYLGKVTVDSVYKVVGMARPKEVREMLNAALDGNFTAAREMLRKLMIEYGLSGSDVVRQIHREIFGSEIKIPEEVRVLIADYLGEIHFRLVEGSDDDIQLSAFLAWLSHIGRTLR